jgi:uncharacterized protein with GYD domain
MPKYLIFASYSIEGVKGFQKDKASGRRAAVSKAVATVGAKLEQMYFTFGEDDVAMVVDAPDNASILAISVAAGASGLCRMRTTPLITVEEADTAVETHLTYPAASR